MPLTDKILACMTGKIGAVLTKKFTYFFFVLTKMDPNVRLLRCSSLLMLKLNIEIVFCLGSMRSE